jgi:hypothetical protein
MFEILILKLCLNIVWADDNVHAQPSRWERGQPDVPSHQVKLKPCTRPSPTYSTYIHVQPCSSFETSPRQSNIGQKACACARPNWGWGGGGKYPHPRQVKSCQVTTHIMAHMRQPSFNKTLTKETDHTC